MLLSMEHFLVQCPFNTVGWPKFSKLGYLEWVYGTVKYNGQLYPLVSVVVRCHFCTV